MPNLAIRDANNQIIFLEASGLGTEESPLRTFQWGRPFPASDFSVAQILVPTAGQIVQLPDFPLVRGVLLKALSSNNGSIFLGKSDVSSSNGFELDKLESVLIIIDQLNKLYITSTSNNEGICLFGA